MTPTLHRRTGTHQPPAPRSQTPSPFLGRLEFPTCHGPRSVIVECVRAGDGYTLHLPAFNEAGNYLIDAPVSLTTVDEHPFSPDACILGRSRVIADGEVSVNGEIERRRGRQLHPGDVVELAGHRAQVARG